MSEQQRLQSDGSARRASRSGRSALRGLLIFGLALVVGGVGLRWAGDASAQVVCTEALPALPAPLTTFCPRTPARATEMNENFRTVVGWIESKVGPVGSSDITVGGAATFTGTVTVPNGTFTGADIQDGTMLLADLDPGIAGTGMQISGSSLQVDSSWLAGEIRSYVRAHCRIRIGWRDACNSTCPYGPDRVSPWSRGDGTCAPGTSGPTTCNGGWVGVNADGDMDGNDNLYVQIFCD